MPFPSPLFLLLEGGNQLKIVDAVAETRKPIVINDKSVYRDSPTPVIGGAAAVNADGSISVQGGVTQTVTDPAGTVPLNIVTTTSVIQEDAFTHIPMRQVSKLDTLIEFWDDTTVGVAMVMSVTTVSGSGVITVPNAELLTPGQGITGTGIPAGTVITSILAYDNTTGLITKTTATMSQQATGTATVAGTLTGSNKVGECLESEFICFGTELSYPT